MKFYEEINRAAQLLKKATYGVAFTGAGISTPSGVPDFRSAKSGLWEHTDPLAVASIFSFRHNPEAFYEWIYPLAQLTAQSRPNIAHETLATMEHLGLIKAVITQNIDMLHTRAGSQIVHELHGHLREATCIQCFTVYPAGPIIEQFLKDRQVPRCPKCHGVIKPNVILFGEQLPAQAVLAAQNAARKTDVMLVIGSSLEVAPASELPALALRNGAKLIIINLEATYVDEMADVVIHADVAEILPGILQHMEASV
jgi:NAD-dependent deacetylase